MRCPAAEAEFGRCKLDDDVFTLPSVSSLIHDLSATISYPLGEYSALRGRFGLAYWEESRGATLPTESA